MSLEKINYIKIFFKKILLRFLKLSNFLNLKKKIKKLKKINNKLLNPEIFNNYNNIKYFINKKNKIEKNINKFNKIDLDLKNIKDLISISLLEKNFSLLNFIILDIKKIKNIIKQLEIKKLFNNFIDKGNCYIDIKSGAGGIESQNWSFMLLRQYLKFCEKKKFKVKILHKSYNNKNSIKIVTIKVKGKYAYGLLKTESGVHRLVRKSPFNSSKNRHTSFSSLFVYPDIDNSINIKINPSDVKIDTFKASGSGGQHINKTNSAVRLTHIPTKIVVQCQNNRSQYRNKITAWKMLKSKIYNFEQNKQLVKRKKIENLKSNISWGQQIRSYVLDQSFIKDLRTNYITYDIKGTLNGNIENFIFKFLKYNI